MNNSIEILINNTESIRKYHLELAKRAIEESPTCDAVWLDKTLTVEEGEVYLLADKLSTWYGLMLDDIHVFQHGHRPRAYPGSIEASNEYWFRQCMIKDLVVHAFRDINFEKLARVLLAKYRELRSQNPDVI